jgi:predicted nucleic acid-binding protein
VKFLVDTNVLSELVRTRPNQHVVRWFQAVPDEDLYLSVLSLGEVRRGIEQLAPGPRRGKLLAWLVTELPDWFEGRVLPVDLGVADRWGRLLAEAGRPVSAVDALLAATALHHGLRLVTRNTSDFGFSELEVVDPWNPT